MIITSAFCARSVVDTLRMKVPARSFCFCGSVTSWRLVTRPQGMQLEAWMSHGNFGELRKASVLFQAFSMSVCACIAVETWPLAWRNAFLLARPVPSTVHFRTTIKKLVFCTSMTFQKEETALLVSLIHICACSEVIPALSHRKIGFSGVARRGHFDIVAPPYTQ